MVMWPWKHLSPERRRVICLDSVQRARNQPFPKFNNGGILVGLLEKLEQIFSPTRQEKRVGLKEIICKPQKKAFIESFKCAAVGCEYSNVDGSDRQEALLKLKAGQRVRLMWDSGDSGNKKTIYLVRASRGREFSMADCFGRLSDDVAADVIRRLTRDNIVAAAKVEKIVGGTSKRPKLGCVLELSLHQGPKSKK
jgi:hypothetical protein